MPMNQLMARVPRGPRRARAVVPLLIAVILLVLKPVLTALFLRTGAVGGMITPAFIT